MLPLLPGPSGAAAQRHSSDNASSRRSRIPHLQPSPLPCAGCHASQTLCQDNTTSKSGNSLLVWGGGFPPCIVYCWFSELNLSIEEAGGGWAGAKGAIHLGRSKGEQGKQICLSSWLFSIIHLCLLSLKVCVTKGFVKQSYFL